MKQVKNLFILLICISLINSCSSEDSNDTPPDGQEEESILCNGIDSDSYWPLAIDNQWVFEGGFDNLILTCEEIIAIDGQDYFKMQPTGDLAWAAIYLREDAEGNIYQHTAPGSETDAEVLYLPANPTLNQEWESFGNCIIGPCSHYKKVESLTYTIETDDCIYENCIAIREYTILNDGSQIDEGLIFFKQGVGYLGANGFSAYLDLVDVTLN